MPGFKIVQTIEKGLQRLFIVPSAWEYKGMLQYPKKTVDYKLARNENSKPRPEWPVMACKVKRIGFPTYEEADEELSLMVQNSDTDVGGGGDENQICVTAETDYNDMASQLMLHSQVDVAPTPSTSSTITTQKMTGETFFILNDTDEILTTTSSQNQPDMVIHKIDTILSNQKDIMEIQKRFAQRLGNFVIEIETKVEKVIKRVLDSHLNRTVTSLAEVSESPQNTAFKLKPIDSIAELEEFEMLLLDPVEKNKLMQTYSILCSASDGHGITCAYKLIDILFTREFLCKCSWSGGSRGDKIKIALKGYKNILDFFFRMVLSWDKSFTIDANEKFFKLVLRNAEQRKNIKNLRKPAMRKRTRTLKTQFKKIETAKRVEPAEQSADKEGDEILEEQIDEVMEKNLEEEVEKDKEDEVEKESEINLGEEVEKDTEDEVEKDLEEERERNLEEDVNEKDLEEEVEEDIEDKVKKYLEKVTVKGKNKKIEKDILNTKQVVPQNVGCEKREKSYKKNENFKGVKNAKVRDHDNQLIQTPPPIIYQRNVGHGPKSYKKLEKLTARKIKAVDIDNESVTPLKKKAVDLFE